MHLTKMYYLFAIRVGLPNVGRLEYASPSTPSISSARLARIQRTHCSLDRRILTDSHSVSEFISVCHRCKFDLVSSALASLISTTARPALRKMHTNKRSEQQQQQQQQQQQHNWPGVIQWLSSSE